MTTLLPLVSQKPFYPACNDSSFPRSSSATSRDPSKSLAIPGHVGSRAVSPEARSSPVSTRRGSARARDENDPFIQASQSSKVIVSELLTLSRRSSGRTSRKSSRDAVIITSSEHGSVYARPPETGLMGEVDITARSGAPYDAKRGTSLHSSDSHSSILHISSTMPEQNDHDHHDIEPLVVNKQNSPASVSHTQYRTQEPHRKLRRWMTALRRTRVKAKPLAETVAEQITHENPIDTLPTHLEADTSRKRETSLSSGGLVSAVRSAGVGIVSYGLGLNSRRPRGASQRRSWARSSGASNAQVRSSEDGNSVRRAPVLDEAVWRRACQRRRILEELISSEESYIADMKILVNVYFGLLASVPTVSDQLRTSIHRNLTEILDLHEQLLGEIRRVVPQSEYSQKQSCPAQSTSHREITQSTESRPIPEPLEQTKGALWARLSFDISQNDRMSQIGVTAEPGVVQEVAKVFSSLLQRFFVYEEYGAKYEMLVRNIGSTYKTIPTWHAYERGIEALANSLACASKHDPQARKGLTFEDLIIKPIQRVCKYPLLFAELYKATPVYDGPDSHAELEKVLYRLREVTAEINKATHDPQTRDKIEKTWLLQDRLIFPNQLHASQMVTLRLLGRVILCGVLHVAWQGHNGVIGCFMICILFRSCLVFAKAKESGQSFAVVACIDLQGIKIEQADGGKGLQCHTALFTWKVVFESDYRLFEMILSACSAKEEEAWKKALHERSLAERSGADECQPKAPTLLSLLTLDIKPIGQVFGQLGTLARRLSIQRASTIGSKSTLSQVVIRNTHALRDGLDSRTYPETPMNRSQSLLSTARIPVLTSRRSDRIRLEHALAELWTRDVIPYPGMGGRRSEYLIKASASSMMRKLSIASITSTFTKRSTSVASYAYPERDSLSSVIDDQNGEPITEVEKAIGRKDSNDTIYSDRKRPPLDDDMAGELSEQDSSMNANVDGSTVVRRSFSPKKTKLSQTSGSCRNRRTKTPLKGAKDDRNRTGKLTRKFSIDGIRKLFQ